MPDRPLFLERASFHRRRLGDAARILPVLTMLLLLVPVWWMPASLSYAAGAVWLFGLWAALIVVVWLLHRALLRAEAATIRASEVAPPGPMPPGPMPPGPMPPGPMPPGPMPAGPMPAGPMPAGPMPAGPMPADPARDARRSVTASEPRDPIRADPAEADPADPVPTPRHRGDDDAL